MRKFSTGTATPTAIIFTMISMFITVGYLKYAMSASVSHKYRFEEDKALLLAETGINVEALPILPSLVDESRLLAQEGVSVNGMGEYKNVVCSTYVDPFDGRTIFHAHGTGVSEFYNTLGKKVTIERMAEANFVAEDFSRFMYFTDSEEPGGGPYTDGTVTFGQNDILEGIVHTNGQLTMSQWGCPDLSEADVSASNGINLNSCNDQNWGSVNDSAEVRDYPPDGAAERAKQNANYVFTADDLLWRSTGKDTLIMTEIEFVTGGFTVSQWTYLIPPVGESGPPPLTFRWDIDTGVDQLDVGSIAFDASYDSTFNFYAASEIFVDSEDIEGTDVFSDLNDYGIGDTVFVVSADPDSNKALLGVLTETDIVDGKFILENDLENQFFESPFVQDEEVVLAYIGGIDNSSPFSNFTNYHNHPNDNFHKCESSGFHHFDFEPVGGIPDIMPPTTFYTDLAVIYVKGGQVRVKGEVDGKFTIITDVFTEYRRHDNLQIIDRVWDNIWLTDNVIYEDSNILTGEVVYGTPNRLGLISGANIIIANTSANGAKNQQAGGSHIIINAALLAMNDSFVSHYWQNSLSSSDLHNPNTAFPESSKGDGRGPYRNPPTMFTSQSDIRGEVKLWGSVSQNKRGYMKRNNPGPYNVSPGVGYDKNYHYDYNFSDFGPPPFFPNSTDVDGNAILVIKSYGEIPKETVASTN